MNVINKPVTAGDKVIGKVISTEIKNGGLTATIQITDKVFIKQLGLGNKEE